MKINLTISVDRDQVLDALNKITEGDSIVFDTLRPYTFDEAAELFNTDIPAKVCHLGRTYEVLRVYPNGKVVLASDTTYFDSSLEALYEHYKHLDGEPCGQRG